MRKSLLSRIPTALLLLFMRSPKRGAQPAGDAPHAALD